MQMKNWLYVEDHCRAIEAVAEKGGRGEIYNISAGNELPNIEIVRKILLHLNKDEGLIEHVEDRKGHDFRYSLNSEKIKILGWKPQISIEDGLKYTIDWYLNNREWWKNLIKYIYGEL